MIYITAILIALAIIYAYQRGLQDGKTIALGETITPMGEKPLRKAFKAIFDDEGKCQEQQEAEEREKQRQEALQRQNMAVDDFCNKGGLF